MRTFLVILLSCHLAFATEPARPVVNYTVPFEGSTNSQVLNLTQFGQKAYFLTLDIWGVGQLWTTDGTRAGTQKVQVDGLPVSAKSLKKVGELLYFTTSDHRLGYVTKDGALVTTDLLVLEDLYDAGDRVLVWAYSSEKTRGQLIHFRPETGAFFYPLFLEDQPSNPLDYSDPILFAGKVYVLATGYNNQIVLVSSDGTAAGTDLVASLYTAPSETLAVTSSSQMIVSQGKLFMMANYVGMPGQQVSSVWLFDGLSAIPELLETINPGNGDSSTIYGLSAFGTGVIYAHTDNHSAELHFADASGSETLGITLATFIARVTSLGNSILYVDENGLQQLRSKTELNQLVDFPYQQTFEPETPFVADASGLLHLVTGPSAEYWVSDGTVGGTHLVEETDQIHVLTDSLSINPIFVNGRLIFSGVNRVDGRRGLVSRTNDGQWQGINVNLVENLGAYNLNVATLASRVLYYDHHTLKSIAGDLDQVVTIAENTNSSLTVLGQKVFFWRSNANGEEELWLTDGTLAQTKKVIGFAPGTFDRNLSGMYVSGNLLYFSTYVNSKTMIWRTDGSLEGTLKVGIFADTLRSNLAFIDADGKGGLYYVQNDVEKHTIWAMKANETQLRQVGQVPRYPLADGELVTFKRAGDREWLLFLDRPDFELLDHTYHVWTTDGTTQGTLLYAEDVQSIDGFRERNGMASFTMTRNDQTGYVLTSGAQPFSSFSAQPDYYLIDGFDFREAGTRFGIKDGRELWTGNGTAAGTKILATFTENYKPYLRLDRANGTVLVFTAEAGNYRAVFTDGTAAGTRSVFTEELWVWEVKAFDGNLYLMVGNLDEEIGPRLYRLSETSEVVLLSGAESLKIPFLAQATESHFYFFGLSPEMDLSLLAVKAEPVAPSLTLTYKRKFLAQLYYEVSVSPIAGASYAWSTEDGTLFQPTSSPTVLVRLGKNRKAEVRLTVTLSDGSVLKGAVTISAPVIQSPGRIVFIQKPRAENPSEN